MSKAPARPSMSKARRLRLWERDKGICYICGLKVKAGELWEAEHKIPWALSFDDTDENLGVAHKDGDCHAAKTKVDVARIAKSKRQAGETGQWARRRKNGPSLKGGSNWPPRGSVKIQNRGFQRNPKGET